MNKDKLIKLVEEGTVKELTDHIIRIIPQFLEHCYIKRSQSSSCQTQRIDAETKSDNFNPSHALIQVDFSENYTCVSQDEIQSAHWKQSQVSLFTVSICHSGCLNSYVFVSDSLVHSNNTVIACIDCVLDQLPDIAFPFGPTIHVHSSRTDACLASLKKRHSVSII